ncbi:PEP-CTERM sorting domain-containing protein [Methylicorpusculum sp.]|uniref:PEP-CTERM sorting domain-containing protein n=1 Tax=Methylicorpusculum sp. TaxID=2713644 RepID=UPI00271C18AE|nr:PEP-CTERM sorting domain-containing protein [Methylicorpusculum sp.]MDO8845321.1 PEP-CTERM sorting domain-containing protein [Methylicorpusculum sp.]
MKHLIRYLSAMLLALSMNGNAQAVSLGTLINENQSIQVEDKLFSDFWWDKDISDSSFQNYDFDGLLNSITVTGLASTPGLLNPGLSFVTNDLLVTSDGLFEFIDLFFGFKVTVIDTVLGPDLFIKDNSLTMLAERTESGDNGVYIREQVGKTEAAVRNILSDGDLGTKEVELSWLDGDLIGPGEDSLDVVNLADAAAFAPQKEVYVSKNILVWADNDGINNLPVTASLNSFDQRFSQTTTTIPEPETWLLLSVGMMGFVFNLKRRKSL